MSCPTRVTRKSPSSSLKSFPPATSIACLIDTTESVSLSLEALPSEINLDNLHTTSVTTTHTFYLLCPASCTVANLQRLLLAKHDALVHEQQHQNRGWAVDIFLGCEYLEPAHSLRELAFLYAWPTHTQVLPLLYRYSDVTAPWWGYPMPRLDPIQPPPLPTACNADTSTTSSSPSPAKKQKRFSSE